MTTSGNLNGEYSTEEDLWIGSQPACTLCNFVQQVPCHLFSRLCDLQAGLNCLILWLNVLTHQSPSQTDMLLNAKSLNLWLNKEAEVLQVSHLQF